MPPLAVFVALGAAAAGLPPQMATPRVAAAPGDFTVTSALTLGTIYINEIVTGTITITNNGAEQSPMFALSIPGNTFAFAGGTCNQAPIPTGGSCSYAIEFGPTATGSYAADITLSIDNESFPFHATGRAIVPWAESPGPHSITDFVGEPHSVVRDLANRSPVNQVMDFRALSSQPADAVAINGGLCPNGTVIGPGAFCSVPFSVTPQSLGTEAVQVHIAVGDGGNGSHILASNFSVTGRSPLELSRSELDFGTIDVGAAARLDVAVVNAGNVNRQLGSSATGLDSSGPFALVNDGCSSGTLVPAASCLLTYEYRPVAAGPHAANETATLDAVGPHGGESAFGLTISLRGATTQLGEPTDSAAPDPTATTAELQSDGQATLPATA